MMMLISSITNDLNVSISQCKEAKAMISLIVSSLFLSVRDCPCCVSSLSTKYL